MGVEDSFAEDHPSPRAKYPAKLAKGGVLVWHLSEHRDQECCVDAGVFVGQRSGIALHRLDVLDACLSGSLGQAVEHLLLQVEREQPALWR